LDILENDALSVAMALWAGTLDFVDKLPEGAELTHFDLLGLALGDYRPDDLVLDLIMNANNPQREFMQLYHHLGYEMYFGHEKYLLNAGGKFINQIDAGTGKIDAWAVPISILPSVGGVNKAQLIRIIGDTRDNKKANMCVTKNFACGLNIIIPDEIPETCMEKMDHWTFLNFSKDSCPKKYGFFVAIYSKSCDSLRCKLGGNNFGFFEIQTPEKMNYETFKKKVVDHNSLSKYSSKKWGAYINSHGEKIKFHVNPWKKNIYPIEDERFPFIKGNLKSWPHAWGDFMSSGGRGLLEIKNPYLDKKIIFDVTDPLNPKRSI
jgi:hypothetical protein